MVDPRKLLPGTPLRPLPVPSVTLLGNVRFSVEVQRGAETLTLTLEVSPATALRLGAGLIDCCDRIAGELVRQDEREKMVRVLQGGH